MKFLPEQKNKQIWSVALLLIAVAGIVYLNFFSGPPKAELVSEEQIAKTMTLGKADTAPDASQPPSQTTSPAAKKSQGGLLPYGTKIETTVIEQEKFKILKPAPPLSVKPEELGKDDLFAR